MAYPTDRIILCDKDMGPLPELAPSEVFLRVRSEEINAEHELTLVTTRRMEVGWRALTVDATGRWREWVVTEPDEAHQSGDHAIGTYRLVWSLQYDLTHSYTHANAVSIGLGNPMTCAQAAAKVLEGVPFWTVSPNCDGTAVTTTEGCVFIYESAWSKLSKLVEAKGYEVDAEIVVSALQGVTARRLVLTAHVGNANVVRRFDWGRDLTEIRRVPDPGPYYCRVVPLGRGQTEYADDDETSFEWPLDITEETTGGRYWIQDDESAQVFRYRDASNNWVYPAKAVSYDEDDPELLVNAATEDLHNHTRPNVTYEASVAQFVAAGMDATGVELGDETQCVDRGFNPDQGLAVQGRVMHMEVNETDPDNPDVSLTIGQMLERMSTTISKSLSSLSEQTSRVSRQVSSMTTAKYIKGLLDRINAEIAADGGYTYFVEGQGVITYDTAVSDPLAGSEASKVVQIKGGSIRIADTKKSSFSGIDDWNWTSVFTAGGITASLINAIQVTTGLIGDSTSTSYWNIDSGELVIVSSSTNKWGWVEKLKFGNVSFTDGSGFIDGITTAQEFLGLAIGYDGTNHTWDGTGKIYIIPNFGQYVGTQSNGYTATGIMTPGILKIFCGDHTLNSSYKGVVSIGPYNIELNHTRANTTSPLCRGLVVRQNAVYLAAYRTDYAMNMGYRYVSGANIDFSVVVGDTTMRSTVSVIFNDTLRVDGNVTMGSSSNNTQVDVYGGLYVHGTKSRVAGTDSYGDRLLYAYETPEPLFGDVGSGVIGEDGVAVVSIDDILAEAMRTDMAYQVFLQKCGRGDLWVSQKTPQYFVVEGTPGLPFDWELKGHQTGFESERLEDMSRVNDSDEAGQPDSTDMSKLYEEELAHILTIESLYNEEEPDEATL